MSRRYSNSAVAGLSRRVHHRAAVALPAIVTLAGQNYSARVLNIAPGGALIECSASFPPAVVFLLRCGSIAAESIVIWEKDGQFGLSFRTPLSEQQITEQLSRNGAMCSRRTVQAELTRPIKGRPKAVAAGRNANTLVSSVSAEHLWAIEGSHQRVESCMIDLEIIMGHELTDLGQFSAVRLRLRQANLARTQIALAACHYLVAGSRAEEALHELQLRELEVSQKISTHVQLWPVPRLQEDWHGYCRATAKVLEHVRGLIAAERELLYDNLRG